MTFITRIAKSMPQCLGIVALTSASLLPLPTIASSHQDAPLVTFDDAANTTDVYAFLTERGGIKYLFTGLAVYPFETPGIGPNKHNFDDNVLYEIHVATGNDVGDGETTFSYQFLFETTFKNTGTILQSYDDVITQVGGVGQNLVQTYTVTRITQATGQEEILGTGIVPPNNQGNVTPLYNKGDDGERPAKDGVDDPANLDPYTMQSIATLNSGHRSFAGQREDGFFADIQAVFDLLMFRAEPDPDPDPDVNTNSFDSQSGFNVHFIGVEIPVSTLGGDMQVVGVYATTSRRQLTVLRSTTPPRNVGRFVQVGRQGNPLFNEGFVAIEDKDLYSRTKPTQDDALFRQYAEEPELGALVNQLFGPLVIATGRTDLGAIFIPDLIKVDLSTEPARLTGGGNDDPDFSRLGIFGGDALLSQVQPGFFNNGTVPGGWPNGRRFGDDVLDIALIALFSDLRDPVNPTIIFPPVDDNVDANDSEVNKVFPYAGTPHNGRNYRANPNQVQIP